LGADPLGREVELLPVEEVEEDRLVIGGDLADRVEGAVREHPREREDLLPGVVPLEREVLGHLAGEVLAKACGGGRDRPFQVRVEARRPRSRPPSRWHRRLPRPPPRPPLRPRNRRRPKLPPLSRRAHRPSRTRAAGPTSTSTPSSAGGTAMCGARP